jgi:hypothetical protein
MGLSLVLFETEQSSNDATLRSNFDYSSPYSDASVSSAHRRHKQARSIFFVGQNKREQSLLIQCVARKYPLRAVPSPLVNDRIHRRFNDRLCRMADLGRAPKLLIDERISSPFRTKQKYSAIGAERQCVRDLGFVA